MQIEFLLNNSIKTSPTLTLLVSHLQALQQSCLKRATTEKELRHCSRDREDYENYLREYKRQFVQKGEEICLGGLRGGLDERRRERRKCVGFYMKGFKVFEENAKDKLSSLVHKLAYTQL